MGSVRNFFRSVDKRIERSVPTIERLMRGFLILVAVLVGLVVAAEQFRQTGGLEGPWGEGLRIAVALTLLLGYLGTVAFVVSWASRRGWTFGDRKGDNR